MQQEYSGLNRKQRRMLMASMKRRYKKEQQYAQRTQPVEQPVEQPTEQTQPTNSEHPRILEVLSELGIGETSINAAT